MLEGLSRYVDGRIRRSAWSPRADDTAPKLAALEALSRYGRTSAAMVSSVSVDPARLPASALLDWIALLGRVEAVPRRGQQLAQAEAILRARLSYSGTRLTFVQEEQDRWWWMMASPDSNAARVLLWAVSQPDWKADAPKLLTGVLGRMRRGAWDTTTANAWGMVALQAFSARFEAQPVGGVTTVSLEDGNAPARTHVQRWPAAPPAPGAQAKQVPATTVFTLPLGAGDATVRISHDGTGQPWAMAQALAAIPLTRPRFAGYRLAREVEAVQRKSPQAWSRGDIVRVRLTIDAAQPMTWVVLSDPLPAGATVLGSGLGRDSAIALADPQVRRDGAASRRDTDPDAPRPMAPTFVERMPDSVRAYFEYLPAGQYRYAYTLRLNQDGEFGLPPTRAEAMYAPEIFGELPNARLQVQP
jgi:uncharacterized protein YfaS (alpha-2-macroglobulin family)